MSRVTTKRQRITTVAEEWRRQYFEEEGGWRGNKEAIYNKLLALDLKTATPQDVKAVIGNDSWTSLWCSECGENVSLYRECGAEDGYDSSTANLCETCLRQALKEIEDAK